METGKFFITLQNLSPQELLRFGEFVASPFFNKNKELIRLYSIILRQTELQKEITREKLFALLYRNKPYDARRMTDLIYYLNNLLEEFVATERSKKDVFTRNLAFFSEARERDIDKVVLSVAREMNAQLETSRIRDNEYYYHNYLFNNEQDKFFSAKGKIKQDQSLQKKSDNFDIFFLSAKLQDACEMLNRGQIVHAVYEDNILEKLLEHIEEYKAKYAGIPVISVYLNILKMLRNPADETYLHNLLTLLAHHGNIFEKLELRDLYNYAQNYCIRRINAGETAYMQTLFDIYKELLKDNLIFQGKHLTKWDYKNIISLGLRLKEYEWTLKFIQDYKNKLPDNEGDNAYTYNLANYYYETGDYKKAVKLLRNVEFTDVYYNLDSKTMLLKIYYDTEEDENLISLVAAFKIYLKRNKLISEANHTLYRNLLKYTVKVLNLNNKLPYQRGRHFVKQLALIKKQITDNQNIANKKWLLAQIEAIGKEKEKVKEKEKKQTARKKAVSA